MLLLLGAGIICGAIYLLIKGYESRFILASAGLLMAVIAGSPVQAFSAFTDRMAFFPLLDTILSVAGFACVIRITKCDAHLIHLLVNGLRHMRPIIVFTAVLATAFANMFLPAAAGVAAAIGSILIPLMLTLGVHPAIAASAVVAGTFASMLSPGLMHNPFVAKMANMDVMQVIFNHGAVTALTVLIGAISLAVVAKITKEDHGYVPEVDQVPVRIEKVNLLYAALPVVPVLLLMLASYVTAPYAPEWGKAMVLEWPWLKGMPVTYPMILGSILCIALTRTNPVQAVNEFFNGMGQSYTQIMGIIIAAAMFVSGMNALGISAALNQALLGAESLARIATAWGPFFLATITGSGDAAALAFNEAVSPHAAKFGFAVADMGSLAALSGALGRSMSPLAGVVIIAAGIAKVNPLEVTKRNAPGMLLACLAAMLLML